MALESAVQLFDFQESLRLPTAMPPQDFAEREGLLRRQKTGKGRHSREKAKNRPAKSWTVFARL
jgi:hypothetical protein